MKKLIISSILLIIFFPILILTPSPIGVIPYDIGLAIIGYSGAIIGGLLTLGGVWWTIKRQEEQRREDLSIQYKPILKIKNIDKKTERTFGNLNGYFKINNEGRGEACNITLTFETKASEDGNFFILPFFNMELSEKNNLIKYNIDDISSNKEISVDTYLIEKNTIRKIIEQLKSNNKIIPSELSNPKQTSSKNEWNGILKYTDSFEYYEYTINLVLKFNYVHYVIPGTDLIEPLKWTLYVEQKDYTFKKI